MKSIIIFLIGLLFLIHPNQAQQYTIVKSESIANWTGYGELGSFEQTGTIRTKNGSIMIEDDEITAGEIVFDMSSIAHVDKSLQKHLKAKDFFHVKKYPTATFEFREMKENEMFGVLVLRGISQTVSFMVEMQQKKDIVVLKGNAKIDRTKFDIKYNSSTYFQDLGSYAIKNDFDLQFDVVFGKVD